MIPLGYSEVHFAHLERAGGEDLVIGANPHGGDGDLDTVGWEEGSGMDVKKGDNVLVIVQSRDVSDMGYADGLVDAWRAEGVNADSWYGAELTSSFDEYVEGLNDLSAKKKYDSLLIIGHGGGENHRGKHVWIGGEMGREVSSRAGDIRIPSSGEMFDKYADALGGLLNRSSGKTASIGFYACGSTGEFQKNLHNKIGGDISISGFSGEFTVFYRYPRGRPNVYRGHAGLGKDGVMEHQGGGFWNGFDKHTF